MLLMLVGAMRCQNCLAEYPRREVLLSLCDSALGVECPKCGFDNPPEARFCAQCVTLLDAVAPNHAEAEPSEREPTGERRHLTVFFCNLIGSMAIAVQL
jgi:hypothetical protein